MSRYDVVIVCERNDPGVRKVLSWLHARDQDLVNVDHHAGNMFSREVWAGAVELENEQILLDEICSNVFALDMPTWLIREQGHPLRDNGTKGGQ